MPEIVDDHPIVTIQEAGLDGFWIHRALENEGVESHVVDPASIAVSRRRRRAKTDRIDGEALLRALMAYKRGEPRVCAMVRAPSPEEEDRRRVCRERKALTNERVAHVNRIKGLLFSQGVTNYEPLRRDRRQRLEELQTGDGRTLPQHTKAQIGRELARLELILEQIRAVEDERRRRRADYLREGAACQDVTRNQGHRPRVRFSPIVRVFVPTVRQSPSGRRVHGIGANAMANWTLLSTRHFPRLDCLGLLFRYEMRSIGPRAGLRAPGGALSASWDGYSLQKDQPLEVVDEVRHADFQFCSGDPDRAYEQPHSILLLWEDMFDA